MIDRNKIQEKYPRIKETSKSARSRSPHRVLPSYVAKHVFNGRLTHITNNRINFADEDKEKKGKKKEKKKDGRYIVRYTWTPYYKYVHRGDVGIGHLLRWKEYRQEVVSAAGTGLQVHAYILPGLSVAKIKPLRHQDPMSRRCAATRIATRFQMACTCSANSMSVIRLELSVAYLRDVLPTCVLGKD